MKKIYYSDGFKIRCCHDVIAFYFITFFIDVTNQDFKNLNFIIC